MIGYSTISQMVPKRPHVPPPAKHKRKHAQAKRKAKQKARQAHRKHRRGQATHRRAQRRSSARHRSAHRTAKRHARRTIRHHRRQAQKYNCYGHVRRPQDPARGNMRSCGTAIILGLCVVVVEVIVSSRPRRAVGSARSTQQSSIACARSSRMLQLPASVGAGPRGRPRAAAQAATSPASPPRRIAMHALLPDTWKRPRKRPSAGQPIT